MFHQAGDKLKICSYLFMIFYTIKSLIFRLQYILSIENLFSFSKDIVFAFIVSLLIYGCSYIVKLYENKNIL